MYDQPVVIKKKKAHKHAHHGGSWKVAYADFVTAMMAFFMVLWILGMSDADRKLIAQYFQDPIGFTKDQPRSKVNLLPWDGKPAAMMRGKTATPGADAQSEQEKTLGDVKEQVTRALEKAPGLADLPDSVVTSMTAEGLRIELIEKKHSTFFDSSSAKLKPAGERLIADIAPIIAKTGRPIRIEGHTDAMPYGGEDYTNWELSTDRASSVRRALCRYGVKERQVQGVHGYADTKLKDPQNPYAAINRRVTILLPFGPETLLPRDQLGNEIRKATTPPKLRFESP